MSSQPNLLQVKRDVIAYGRRAIKDGLITGTAGNFSVRVGDVMVITASGVAYDRMRTEQVCVVGVPDAALRSGTRPSSETPMHLAVYRACDAGAVVHTHSPFVVALSSVLDVLPAVHYAMARLGGPVRVAPYARFGSDDLASAAVEGLHNRAAVILGNHGALAYGATLSEAYQRASILEWLAAAYWHASLVGCPKLLDERQLDDVLAAQALG